MTTVYIPPGSNIDHYLRTHRSHTRFVLSEGIYTTASAFAFADLDYTMLGNRCELIGAGQSKTIIWVEAFRDLIPKGAAQMECLTAGSRSQNSSRVELRGFTLGRSSVGYDLPGFGIVGVHIWSDSCSVRDVGICSITGKRQAPGMASSEGFGLLVNQSGSPGLYVGGSTIEDVIVTVGTAKPAGDEHYVCGVYVGYPNPHVPSSVRFISVVNPSDAPAHAAFGLNGGIMGSEWSCRGRWNRAIFCDVSGGSRSRVANSDLRAERVAMELRGAGVAWRDIVLADSFIELAPQAEYAAALVLADDEGSIFDNVVIRSCELRGTQRDPVNRQIPIYHGSIDAPNAIGCGLSGCRLSGPTPAWNPAVTTKRSPGGAFSVT